MTVTFQVTVTSGGTLRATRTFILRLLVDSAGPEALRGDLRPMPEGEAQPFPDEQALLALLHRLASPAPESPPEGEQYIGNHSNPERKKN